MIPTVACLGRTPKLGLLALWFWADGVKVYANGSAGRIESLNSIVNARKLVSFRLIADSRFTVTMGIERNAIW